MKILVPLKRVAVATQPLRIAADGRSIDVSSVVPIINPFDAIAVEAAVRLRENGAEVSEIVIVSIGPAATVKELRGALAGGAIGRSYWKPRRPLIRGMCPRCCRRSSLSRSRIW